MCDRCWQVFNATPPFTPVTTIDTGVITNHVNFASNANGQFAYVTVGGLNVVKVFTTDDDNPQLVATIPVGDFPHGLWPTGDGSRMYVGLENGNEVVAIDTITNTVLTSIPIGGQSPMGMLYVPNAAPDGNPPAGAKNTGLTKPGIGDSSLHFQLISKDTNEVVTTGVLNRQGLLDLVSLAVTSLQPGEHYGLALSRQEVEEDNGSSSSSGGGGKQEVPEDQDVIAEFQANPDGGASVTSIGPFRTALFGDGARKPTSLLVIYKADSRQGDGGGLTLGQAVQVQRPLTQDPMRSRRRQHYLRRRV